MTALRFIPTPLSPTINELRIPRLIPSEHSENRDVQTYKDVSGGEKVSKSG